MPTYYAINGNKAFEIGDEDRAREWYKKACETGRANVKLKSSYAYVLLRTGYADEAEKVLDPIIRVKGLAPEKRIWQSNKDVWFTISRADLTRRLRTHSQ